MPASNVSINLLGKEDFTRTPSGRIISWAVTYGRYIMIGTEIVVLLAFASRFSLDRKLTDLREAITQKQAILEANSELEQTITNLQEHIAKANALYKDQDKLVKLLDFIKTSLPSDVRLDSLTLGGDKLTAHAVSGTNRGFSQFLAVLDNYKALTRVEIGDVKKSPLTGIEFQVIANLGAEKTEKK